MFFWHYPFVHEHFILIAYVICKYTSSIIMSTMIKQLLPVYLNNPLQTLPGRYFHSHYTDVEAKVPRWWIYLQDFRTDSSRDILNAGLQGSLHGPQWLPPVLKHPPLYQTSESLLVLLTARWRLPEVNSVCLAFSTLQWNVNASTTKMCIIIYLIPSQHYPGR